MRQFFSGFFAIYFFIAGLYPNTDFAQLWHTASAFKHFKLHQEEAQLVGRNCTVWSFIKDHYINPESHQHSDLGDHDQLPAKHLHHALDLFMMQSWPDLLRSPECPSRDVINFIHIRYSFLFNPGVDRPPSVV
ncbi:MAG: hypothetical protein KDC80_01695 [Saprospiraceae bacterium]|nr:hypothetical protein [Saprospiraceae bacterium]